MKTATNIFFGIMIYIGIGLGLMMAVAAPCSIHDVDKKEVVIMTALWPVVMTAAITAYLVSQEMGIKPPKSEPRCEEERG